MTIEERAKKIVCGSCGICDNEPQPCGGSQYSTYKILTQFATEQDSIARQKERERCISIAKRHLCAMCGYSECEYADCSKKHCSGTDACEFVIELCKEINEGGTENE